LLRVQRETSGEFIHHGNYICYFVIDIRHKQYAFLEIGAKIQLYFYKSAFSAINFPYHLRNANIRINLRISKILCTLAAEMSDV
jgi:hypothetical protein